MFVAVCRLELHLPAAQSLKDKRAVVQSVAKRLRNEFGIAVAEVERQNHHHLAVFGLAAVSNEAHHAQEMLERAVRNVEDSRLDAELISADIEVIPTLELR
ncbi:MAG: DUF503 domain-containing protein [Chloroflexi bacterium]|nr:DUF503 domain-containing protein [Chloroflexota bacterium]